MSVCHICSACPCLREYLYTSDLVPVSPSHRPSKHIINILLLQIEDILQHASDLDFIMSIVWVKGHIDIDGNELVDGAAKVAARGDSSQEALLPPEWATSPLPQCRSRHSRQHFTSSGKRLGAHLHVTQRYQESTRCKFN